MSAPTRRSVLGSAAALVAVSALVAAGTANVSHAASPSIPIRFGAAADTPQQVQADEKVLGRHMDGIRDYKSWDSPKLFGSSQIWMRDTRHTLFLSIKAQRVNDTKIKFADIAAAAPGSPLYKDMQHIAAQIIAFKAGVYIIFNHEPEASASTGSGNGPQFAAAFRKFVTVMRASGVRNAKYVAGFTGYGFSRTDSGAVNNYYPGDAYVDAVGADVYNWASCRGDPWTSMAKLTAGITAWGNTHPSKQLMILEFGSVEDPASPTHKAAWYKDVQALFKTPAYSHYVALLQWAGINTTPKCSFNYNTSATSQAAWAAIGRDPSYIVPY